MIKRELKKSVALVLSAAMVLALALPSAGGIKAYADTNPPGHEEIKTYSAGDVSENVFIYRPDDGGLFKSKAPSTKGVTQSEGSDYEVATLSDTNEFIYRNMPTNMNMYPGTVFYDVEANTITAVKNVYYVNAMYNVEGYNFSQYTNVNLVIQGNQKTHVECSECDWTDDYNNDYYLSISLDDTYFCKVQLDKEKGQDVKNCKIWVECSYPYKVGGQWYIIPYAAEAIPHQHTYENKLYYAAEKFLASSGFDGKHVLICDGYGEGTTETMTCPYYIGSGMENASAKKYEDHNYEYVGKDENYHYQLCSECEGYDADNKIKGYIKNYNYLATDTTVDRWTNALEAHTPDEKCVVSATPSEASTYHYNKCKECGFLYNKAEHNFEWSYVYSKHYKKCVDCGYIDETTRDDHHFGDDTICDDCDFDAENEPTWTTVAKVEPTCTEVGYEEHKVCVDDPQFDAMLYTDQLGVVHVIEDISEIEIEPTGHTEGTEYAKNSSTHWHTCTVCGEKIDVSEAAHTFDKNNVCTVCGYRKSSGGSSNTNTGWIKDSKGWRYRNSDGIIAQGSTVTDADGNKVEKVLWQKAGNGYYAFGSDGYLVTGWIYDKLEDKWYYCDENMGKLYGWFNESQDGYWYYLSPSTGEALTGWQSINGKDYYFASAPSAPTYSFDASTGFWIYSNINGVRPFGSMYANTVTPDNYQVDANGAWIH